MYFQETHPDRIFEECSVYNELISSAAQSPRTVNSAIRHAVGLGGVSVITLPGDVSDLKAVEHVPAYAPARPATLAPNATDVEEAASLLNKANKVAIFADAGVETAGKHHGMHSLRHSAASNMLSGGTPYPTISSVLGHSSANVTKRYLSIDVESLRPLALEVPSCL